MVKGDSKELAEQILNRSICHVKVGAVLADSQGVFAWGWNHAGPTGMGQHAEIHCLTRANRKRLAGATMYIAGARTRTGKAVPARPCPDCARATAAVGRIVWRDSDGTWKEML